MKTAIIHDWLYTYAGAERVLEQLLSIWPQADVFTLIDRLPSSERKCLLGNSKVYTSFLQNWPLVSRNHRVWLPFFPLAIEQFDLSDYDFVVSSSYAVAKGVMAGPLQKHLCYCHSPMRYAWDLQAQYLNESGLDRGLKGCLARAILHYIRVWDTASSPRVDRFVANSMFVKERIRRCYGRDADVVHPPVDTEFFQPATERDDFYVTTSRMVPYKKVDLVVEAFSNMPDRRLVVIGDGPGMQHIKKIAGPNIELMGFQSRNVLRDKLQKAKAFIFAAEEDFGIAPVEAQACGTPVIAFGKGGVRDSVMPLGTTSEPTGIFFDRQDCKSVCEAVHQFEMNQAVFLAENCRKNAERFSPEVFRGSMQILSERLLQGA